MAQRPNTIEDVDRWFWSRIKKGRGCWLWQGPTHPDGYGVVKWGGKVWRTSRVAYYLTYGPPDQSVLHRCGVPLCCNPAHLYDGDQRQNMADRKRHGRYANVAGELNPHAKLTAAQVDEIRRSTDFQYVIAARYGIGQSQVSRIKRGESW